MKCYVITMSEDYNPDYVEVCSNLNSVADVIYDITYDENGFCPVDKKELIRNMKEREKKGYISLLDNAEIDEICDIYIRAVKMRN